MKKIHYIKGLRIVGRKTSYSSVCGLKFPDHEKEVFVTEYPDKVNCKTCQKSEILRVHVLSIFAAEKMNEQLSDEEKHKRDTGFYDMRG